MKKQIFALASIVMIGGVLTMTSCSKEDITAPVITVTGGNTINHTLNATFTAPAATATDDEDGDLTGSLTVTSTVNEDLVGSYTVTYSVTDAAGNTATETVAVTVANSASALNRTYNFCHDSCQSGATYDYISVVTTSTTVNGNFVINNFGAFGGSININGTLSGNSISIPASQSLGGTDSIVASSGTVTNTTNGEFGLTYTWTDGAATEVCIGLYR